VRCMNNVQDGMEMYSNVVLNVRYVGHFEKLQNHV
jgi:hypothetical protein